MTDIIAMIANISLAFSAGVAVVFGIAQVKASERDRRERFALEAVRGFQTREFAELLNFINTVKMPATMEERRSLSDEDQIRLIQYSQQMESLGLMVAYGLINEDLVDRTLGSFVTATWKRYEPLFTDMREKLPDPYLGEYFQWLAQRIEEYGQEHPRKPFYKAQG